MADMIDQPLSNPEDISEKEKMDLADKVPIEDIYNKFLSHGQVIDQDPAYILEDQAGEYPLDDEPLTIEDAMLGVGLDEGQGGSGATGGDLTGERTPGGVSLGLKAGRAGGGTYGGPTGGAYIGDNTTQIRFSPVGGDRTYSNEEMDAELARKIAADNTQQLYKDKLFHPPAE